MSPLGPCITVTVTKVELVQPVAVFVPVTVYVVVSSGVAITVEPVVIDKPAAGLQV